MISTGLIGYGMAGRVFHAPLIESVEGLSLRTIVQRSGDEAAQRYPHTTAVRDPEELFSDPSIELVIVATPNASHYDLARRALLAGKHVVVDKPITVTSDEAGQLITLARERNRVLTVFHNRRWDGDFLTVRRLMASKALGRVVALESRFDRFRNQPRPNAWRETAQAGSGILYDIGSHLIDQALVLFGQPERVTSDIRIEREFARTDDSFDLWLHYPRLTVTLRAGMLVREKTPRFVVRGTTATFVKYGVDPQERELVAGRSPRDDGWGAEPSEQWGTLIEDAGEVKIATERGDYRAFYENVRDAIRGTTPLAVYPDDARRTIAIIEMARSSRDSFQK